MQLGFPKASPVTVATNAFSRRNIDMSWNEWSNSDFNDKFRRRITWAFKDNRQLKLFLSLFLKSVVIDPFTSIDGDVVIGEGTCIGSNVSIMDGARIGKNCNIFPGAVISANPQDLKYNNEKTYVEIGDNVTIRECVTINKGTNDRLKTVIGSNCLIMAYSHIAHDCFVGDNCIFSNNTTLAGHVTCLLYTSPSPRD